MRAVGVNILNTSMPLAGQDDLDKIIISTGYPWALRSNELIIDLMATFAASLRNGGGPGPGCEAFSKMVAAAIKNNVIDGRLVKPLEKSIFAQACVDYLNKPQSLPLAINGTVDYASELNSISASRSLRPRALMPKLIDGIIDFSLILLNKYNGSAAYFHSDLNREHKPCDSAKFVLEKFQEISEIPKVGVALAMNFFKDSQVPGLSHIPLKKLFTNQIGWFVKPDIHVLRFMLKATGRSSAAGISDDELIYLKEGLVRRAYVSTKPTSDWAKGNYTYHITRPSSEFAQWYCIEDVHRLAIKEEVSPLEIDRILFMIGSGRFYDSGRIGPSQTDRYRSLFLSLDK